MKSLLVLLAFIGIANAGAKIDFGNCQWFYGDATQIVSCPNGYVGTGACGNKGQTRCDGRAFGIQCCSIVDTTTAPTGCLRSGGSKGTQVSCAEGYQVFSTCGSLDMSRCTVDGSRRCISIDCCKSALDVDEGSCRWLEASNQGEKLFCDSHAGGEEVMTGRCGSETMAKCNSKVHSIRCCKIK